MANEVTWTSTKRGQRSNSHLDSCWKAACAVLSSLVLREGVITAERILLRCRAALAAGSGLLPWELSVRKNLAATSWSARGMDEDTSHVAPAEVVGSSPLDYQFERLTCSACELFTHVVMQ